MKHDYDSLDNYLRLLLLTVEIRAHRDLLVSYFRQAHIEPNGQDALAFLRERIEHRMSIILATLADTDHNAATVLTKIYEESKKPESDSFL